MYRQNSTATASQETLASLMQLDPSPIDSTLDLSLGLDKQLPDLPPPSPPKRASTFSLGGNSHGAVYYLTRAQRYSSYAFTVFSAFHITNTSIIPLITRSVPASEPYLLLTRPYYQSFPLEPLLITVPLLTHIGAGVALRIHRRNKSLVRYGATQVSRPERKKYWPSMSKISVAGYILTPLVFGHAFVNRILPWWVEGGSSGIGLGFVSHGFAKHPAIAWTGYVALVGIASGHIVWGAAKWLDLVPSGLRINEKKDKRRWWSINSVALVSALVWMAGGLGVVGRGGKASGWMARGYDNLYASIPLLSL